MLTQGASEHSAANSAGGDTAGHAQHAGAFLPLFRLAGVALVAILAVSSTAAVAPVIMASTVASTVASASVTSASIASAVAVIMRRGRPMAGVARRP